MNGKKFLIGAIAAFVIVWISLLIVISEDIYDRRPVISLFKMLQSDGSTEIVDFEVDNKKSNTNKPEPNIDKNPYYGDLHVHTKYSFDAYVFGVIRNEKFITMKKNVVWWPAIVNEEHKDKYGGYEYFEYSRKTWEYWCKKNDVELFILEDELQPKKSSKTEMGMKPTWQRWHVFEILENSGIE